MKKKRENELRNYISILIALYPFVILYVLWKVGIFDFDGTVSSSQITVAIIAFAGVLISSVLALLGVLLKQSLENRTILLREEAEKRLRNEATIEAIKQMELMESNNAVIAKNSAIIFMMAKLGSIDLSINMISQMLKGGYVETETASVILDKAIDSDDEILIYDAISIFAANSKKFVGEDKVVQIPDAIIKKYGTFPEIARMNAVVGIIDMLTSTSLKKWEKEIRGRNGLISIICKMWLYEQENIKNKKGGSLEVINGISICLLEIMEVCQGERFSGYLTGKIDIGDIGDRILDYLSEEYEYMGETIREIGGFEGFYKDPVNNNGLKKIFESGPLHMYDMFERVHINCMIWVEKSR